MSNLLTALPDIGFLCLRLPLVVVASLFVFVGVCAVVFVCGCVCVGALVASGFVGLCVCGFCVLVVGWLGACVPAFGVRFGWFGGFVSVCVCGGALGCASLFWRVPAWGLWVSLSAWRLVFVVWACVWVFVWVLVPARLFGCFAV